MKAVGKGICDFCQREFEEPMEQNEAKSGWYMRFTGFTIQRGAIKNSEPLSVGECCQVCYEKCREAVLSVRTWAEGAAK